MKDRAIRCDICVRRTGTDDVSRWPLAVSGVALSPLWHIQFTTWI